MSAIDRLLQQKSTVHHTVVAPKPAGPQKPSRVFSTSSIKVTPPSPVLGNIKTATKKLDVMAHLNAKKMEGQPLVGKNGFSEAELNSLSAEYEEFLQKMMAEMGDEPMFFTPAEEPKPEAVKVEVPVVETSEPQEIAAAPVEPLVQGISVGDETPVDTVIVTKKIT